MDRRIPDANIWSELRQTAALSSKAVCEYTGLSRQFLFNIEKGKSKPSEQNENKILELYRIHLDAQKKLYTEKLEKINKLLEYLK